MKTWLAISNSPPKCVRNWICHPVYTCIIDRNTCVHCDRLGTWLEIDNVYISNI